MRTELNSASRPHLDAYHANKTRGRLSIEYGFPEAAGLFQPTGSRHGNRNHPVCRVA
jgi:hypothetical protein